VIGGTAEPERPVLPSGGAGPLRESGGRRRRQQAVGYARQDAGRSVSTWFFTVSTLHPRMVAISALACPRRSNAAPPPDVGHAWLRCLDAEVGQMGCLRVDCGGQIPDVRNSPPMVRHDPIGSFLRCLKQSTLSQIRPFEVGQIGGEVWQKEWHGRSVISGHTLNCRVLSFGVTER